MGENNGLQLALKLTVKKCQEKLTLVILCRIWRTTSWSWSPLCLSWMDWRSLSTLSTSALLFASSSSSSTRSEQVRLNRTRWNVKSTDKGNELRNMPPEGMCALNLLSDMQHWNVYNISFTYFVFLVWFFSFSGKIKIQDILACSFLDDLLEVEFYFNTHIF